MFHWSKFAVMLTLLIWSTTLTHAQLRQQSDLPQGVSASWWQTVQKNLRESEYHISKRHDSAYTSPNRAQNLRFVYEPNGFSATRRDSLAHLWHARLTFAGLSKSGTNPDSQNAHAFTLTAEANTLVAQSDAVVIKYCNDEKGMRQDFIVKRKPDGNGDLRLWLYAEMQGGTVSTTAERISFLTESGAEAMRYSDLKVWDASHKRLKARFERVGNQVAIVVNDRHALYPITIDPLSTVPNWTAESNQTGAEFGTSVASAGDVNGDGFSDVIVGANTFDAGELDEGRAFVYHGSATGLSTTANWTAESNQPNAQFGFSVASAGDVNGDGFSDVIVGVRLFDNGETNEGRAYVYHGSAAGLGTTANWTAESNQASAYFGWSVASAGDVNGDGFSDVIVGAIFYDGGQADEGRAFLYHGSASGLSTTPNWTAESNQNFAWLGWSVASAGDVNGDGFSDIIIGSYYFDNGQLDEGAAFVWHGSSSGVNSDIDGTPANAAWFAESNQADSRFGYSVASAGDVNGDGFSDIIVGADFFDNGEGNEGRAFVYHGSAAGLSTTPNWTAEGNQPSALFGYSVASAGDVNGDGFSDVIVGAYLFENGESDEGGAFVYHGSAAGLSTTANWTGESNQVIAYLGYTVASAGDVNGDGFSDVIVGAPTFDNGQSDEGAAFVYYGNGGSGLRQEVRQFRPSTTTPIVPALKTNSLNSVTLQKRRQSIAGRSTMQLEFEVKPLGTAFNGLGLQNTGFSLHATGGTPTSALIGGLSDRTLYKWRVRQVEKSTGIGYILLPRSRWYYPAGVAPTESHFQVSSDALPLPVELSSFSAQRVERGVELVWTTASEKNNAGFEVQRRSEKQASEEWQVLGFVKGNGTTSDAKSYSFVDRTASGKVQYRLKQVDFDGTFEYSPVIEVEAGMPRTFELGQNYPNPFNPTTLISYQLPVASEVSLKVYDVLGREVMTLVNGKQDAGSYNLNFNASNLSSGVYFYRLQAGSFVQTKKMMLVK
jgi:hypothetical protein